MRTRKKKALLYPGEGERNSQKREKNYQSLCEKTRPGPFRPKKGKKKNQSSGRKGEKKEPPPLPSSLSEKRKGLGFVLWLSARKGKGKKRTSPFWGRGEEKGKPSSPRSAKGGRNEGPGGRGGGALTFHCQMKKKPAFSFSISA